MDKKENGLPSHAKSRKLRHLVHVMRLTDDSIENRLIVYRHCGTKILEDNMTTWTGLSGASLLYEQDDMESIGLR